MNIRGGLPQANPGGPRPVHEFPKDTKGSITAHSSPGVWHRAEGTPKKGGLRWGPRVMCGAFWGDSKGAGCDSSLWTAGW